MSTSKSDQSLAFVFAKSFPTTGAKGRLLCNQDFPASCDVKFDSFSPAFPESFHAHSHLTLQDFGYSSRDTILEIVLPYHLLQTIFETFNLEARWDSSDERNGIDGRAHFREES